MVWLLVIIAGLTVGCVVLYCRLRQMESVDRARQSLFADELRDAEAALLAALERVEAMDRRLASRERQAAEPATAPAGYASSRRGMQPNTQFRHYFEQVAPKVPVMAGVGLFTHAETRMRARESANRYDRGSIETQREGMAPQRHGNTERNADDRSSSDRSVIPSVSPCLRGESFPSLHWSAATTADPLTVRWPRRSTRDAALRERALELARTGRSLVQIARALEMKVGEVELLLAFTPRAR